jgi:dipeptidase E
MRLLLSSWFLTPDNRPSALPATLTNGTARAGIVLNALDQLGGSRNRDYARERHTLETFGYSCEELDLRDYFSAPDELAKRLADLHLVWAMGGNAFVLARAVTQARLGEALRAQLDRPDFTYGGYSAGACVAGPDLRGIDLIDDPNVVPERYPTETAPECLGLVPFRIVPHWRSDHPETEGAERAATHLAQHGLAHRCLRDGDVLSIHDARNPGETP